MAIKMHKWRLGKADGLRGHSYSCGRMQAWIKVKQISNVKKFCGGEAGSGFTEDGAVRLCQSASGSIVGGDGDFHAVEERLPNQR